MRYLTHYKEYTIYEPAEGGYGGYYYFGNQIVESERMSKRKARAKMKRLCAEAMKINEKYDSHDWQIFCDGNFLRRTSRYIGHGESYVIERRKGSREYC